VLIGLKIGLEQLVEERAVMDECLTLRLRADVALLLRQVEGVRGSIVLNHVRMIDRDEMSAAR
jgi:hypothetical protein